VLIRGGFIEAVSTRERRRQRKRGGGEYGRDDGLQVHGFKHDQASKRGGTHGTLRQCDCSGDHDERGAADSGANGNRNPRLNAIVLSAKWTCMRVGVGRAGRCGWLIICRRTRADYALSHTSRIAA
jgi:hypothetical protein